MVVCVRKRTRLGYTQLTFLSAHFLEGPHVKLYSVSFQASVKRGNKDVPLHDVILDAENEDDAKTKAKQAFKNMRGLLWNDLTFPQYADAEGLPPLTRVLVQEVSSILAYSPIQVPQTQKGSNYGVLNIKI